MIGYLSGKIEAVVRDTIIVSIESSGGTIGYRIRTLAPLLAEAQGGKELALWTHLAIRENAHELYGFETKDELQWFELLLTVSGVGPRSALNILNSVDIETLAGAIASNDASVLARAFGIGRKTAEKIVLELKEKVAAKEGVGTASGDGEIVDALVSLGYTLKEARDAARAVPREVEGEENRIREALRLMSRG